MKKKIKEMDRKRTEERGAGGRRGIGSRGITGSSIGGGSYDNMSSVVPVTAPMEQPKYTSPAAGKFPGGAGLGKKGMQLGSKRGNVDSFVDQLKNEGEGMMWHLI